MVGMGFARDEVRDSLVSQKYNEVMATYLLLGHKNEVCFPRFLYAGFENHLFPTVSKTWSMDQLVVM